MVERRSGDLEGVGFGTRENRERGGGFAEGGARYGFVLGEGRHADGSLVPEALELFFDGRFLIVVRIVGRVVVRVHAAVDDDHGELAQHHERENERFHQRRKRRKEDLFDEFRGVAGHDGDDFGGFPFVVVRRSENGLEYRHVTVGGFGKRTGDRRKRVDGFLFATLLEVGVDLYGLEVVALERGLGDVRNAFGKVVDHAGDFDLRIVRVDLVFQKVGVRLRSREEKPHDAAQVHDFEREFRRGIRLGKPSLLRLHGVVEDIENLFRDENPLLVETVDPHFEHGAFMVFVMFHRSVRKTAL